MTHIGDQHEHEIGGAEHHDAALHERHIAVRHGIHHQTREPRIVEDRLDDHDTARQVQEAEAYKAQIVQLATGDASRFNQLLTAYEKAPNVTRERLYIESVESVLRGSKKVLIDSKNGNGNVLYLPLDKLAERSRTDDKAE